MGFGVQPVGSNIFTLQNTDGQEPEIPCLNICFMGEVGSFSVKSVLNGGEKIPA